MNYIEYLGYVASALVIVSLMMKSLIRLRMLNLIGGILFTIYSIIIGAIPVVVLNGALVSVNIYYLFIKRTKEKNDITLLPVNSKDIIQLDFFKINIQDIKKFFGDIDITKCEEAYLIIKNDHIAGIFAGNRNDDIFDLSIDFVSAAFRDYEIGKTLYQEDNNILISRNMQKLQVHTNHPMHEDYLLRMGFSTTTPTNDTALPLFSLSLV